MPPGAHLGKDAREGPGVAGVGVRRAVPGQLGETVGERNEPVADRTCAIEGGGNDARVEPGDCPRGSARDRAVPGRRDGPRVLAGERAGEAVVVRRELQEDGGGGFCLALPKLLAAEESAEEKPTEEKPTA